MSWLDLLKVYHHDNKKRLGDNKDGGYVIADLTGYDGYVSAGISDEESFSRDFIQLYKLNDHQCFGFDGTISSYPYTYTTNISFIRKNIGCINDESTTDLSWIMNHHTSLFLKMDIEGGEYPWILHTSNDQLNKIKQLVIEFHGIHGNDWGCSREDKLACLKKMSETHYIVHAHGNNWAGIADGIPDVIELTYVNKNCFDKEPSLNETLLPIPEVDFPNCIHRPDYTLNVYPFVHRETVHSNFWWQLSN
jgi:hypothetical protein